MIINFTVQNFLSFKEPQTLSFVASAPYNIHENHLLDTPIKNIKLLKAVIIYGANASGKSNFLAALHHFQRMVLTSAQNNPTDTLWKHLELSFLLNKESRCSPSTYEINFFCNDIQYYYSISFDNEKVNYEYLSYFPNRVEKLIFKRVLEDSNVYKFKLGIDLKPKRVYNDIALKTPKNTLFLSKAVQENSQFLAPIYDWFFKGLSHSPDEQDVAKIVSTDDTYKKLLLNFIRSQDINIVSLDIDKESLSEKLLKNELDFPAELKEKLLQDLKNRFHYEITTYHKDNTGELVAFPFELESKGTYKLFEFSLMIMEDSLYPSKCFYIDELGSDLHPLLVKNFMETFQKTNNQLIAVTHDTHLIDSACLRKDQIYFIEKNTEQASVLYSLSDFNPRNDRENWELRYLTGRYGATPFFKD